MLRTAILRAPGTWALLLVSLILAGTVVANRLDGWVAWALSLEQVFDAEHWRADKIKYTYGLIDERLERRKSVGRALLRGEVTLEAAAAEFRELDQWPPREDWHQVRHRHPGVVGTEFHCLTVIEFAKAQLAADPGSARAVAEKLGRELDQLRARRVEVRLGVVGEEWF